MENVNTVVHVQIPLAFHGDGEFVVDEVKENVGSALIGGSDCKIIDLSFKECALAVDDTGVQARFVYPGCHADILENSVGVLFLESGRFRVALHCREDRDDLAWFQWWAVQMLYPPFIEGTIG